MNYGRRRGWGPPERPSWWPEGEAWPPRGGPPWQRVGRRFMWRALLFAAVAFVSIAVLVSLGMALVGTATGFIPTPHAFRFLSIIVLALLLFLLVRAGRGFGRMALDVGELIDAAGKIERGQFGVQVRERGPAQLRTLIRSFNAMSARLATTDQSRRAFVADLSHELRTPLAVIRGQAEAIGDGVYPPDDAHVAPIVDATESLETLVDALGTMTLADVGSLRLNREPIEVSELINSTLAGFGAMADNAGVRLASTIAPDLPPINADPARIRGVLMNLLSNAIRYTPSGGTVAMSAERSNDSVTISVRDTGQGVPEELRGRAFERFVKGPGSSGAGLGLAISKDVVTAHGGTIDLSSEVGKGTEVRVSLPIAR